MAKKKTVKKVRGDRVREGQLLRGEKARMNAAEIKMCMDVVNKVITGKSKGFVYAAAIQKDELNADGNIPVQGTLYSTGTSPIEMVYNLITSLNPDPVQRRMFMLKLIIQLQEDE